MKEFIEKLIGRLEEEKLHYFLTISNNGDEKLDAIYEAVVNAIDTNILIVNQLAEEYKDKVIIDGQYCWQTCSATEHCKECNRLCNGGIDYYENYDILAEEYNNKDCSKCSRRSWYQKGYADAENNNGWIPCEFELPKYTGEYNVTVVVASELGSFEDVTTLRFENIKGKEPRWIIPKDEIYRVIAWQPLPEPFKQSAE